jgi:hypothetical protein
MNGRSKGSHSLPTIPVDTSSYAVWSENNHTNTNITLETMNDLKGCEVLVKSVPGYDQCEEGWW